MIVVDASAIIAYLNRADPHNAAAGELLERGEVLAITPLVLVEVDYVLARRGGRSALEVFRAHLEAGVYDVRWWPEAIRDVLRVLRDAGRDVGLADASLVALAGHLGTTRIATFDQDFATLTPLTGESAFALLPA